MSTFEGVCRVWASWFPGSAGLCTEEGPAEPGLAAPTTAETLSTSTDDELAGVARPGDVELGELGEDGAETRGAVFAPARLAAAMSSAAGLRWIAGLAAALVGPAALAAAMSSLTGRMLPIARGVSATGAMRRRHTPVLLNCSYSSRVGMRSCFHLACQLSTP